MRLITIVLMLAVVLSGAGLNAAVCEAACAALARSPERPNASSSPAFSLSGHHGHGAAVHHAPGTSSSTQVSSTLCRFYRQVDARLTAASPGFNSHPQTDVTQGTSVAVLVSEDLRIAPDPASSPPPGLSTLSPVVLRI